MNRHIRTVASVIGGTAALAGVVVTAQGSPADAAVRHQLPSCSRELAAYRQVSQQAGIVIGSDSMAVPTRDEARSWFYELSGVNYPLAVTAGGISSPDAAAQFVMALTASAAAALEVINGASPAGICGTGGPVMVPMSVTADTSAAVPAGNGDLRFCRSFPEYGSSLRRAERTVGTWGREIRGTDSDLHHYAAALRAFLAAHPRASSAHGAYRAVYQDCNPDA